MNSQLAARRADDLEARMNGRLGELELEKNISALPPVVAGGAIVVPQGLLNLLAADAGAIGAAGDSSVSSPSTPSTAVTADIAARKEIEARAMAAVMEIETSLGNEPHDVISKKEGWDVLSLVPLGSRGPGGAMTPEAAERLARAFAAPV
jgi:hypothetical protein